MADDPTQPGRAEDTEGVRIIGAEEAQAAVERDDVAQRLPDDAPRFGDRPESQTLPAEQPAIRFPLSASSDPADIERPSVVPPDPPRAVPLPHWTDPPTGEVPRILGGGDDEEEDLDAWTSFTSSQPRWRGEGGQADDDYDDFSALADDDTRIGALDTSQRLAPDEYFDFDEPEEPEPEPAPPPAPMRVGAGRAAARARSGVRPARPGFERPADAGRDLQTAIGVGVGILAAFLLLAKIGPGALMVLVVVVVTLAVVELYTALRKAGYHSAGLLGITATAALPIAAYAKGEVAHPLVLGMTAVAGLLWYLIGAGGDESPVQGLATTLLGVGYVGVLGSFAALILALPSGIGVLWAAVLMTVGYDVFAFVVGRSLGETPLSAASPNKTREGLMGGVVGAAFGAIIVRFISPWDTVGFGKMIVVALIVSVAATLGDLCESMIKRDLEIKDMGTILPGHGGVLDRFDALLFVLPVTYYAARIILF